MKRILLVMTGGMAVLAALAENPPSYSLAIPGAPVIRNTMNASENAWLASNSVASVSAAFAAGGVSRTTTPGQPVFTLASGEAGFSVERIKPEIWLGDELTPPENVDWNATYEFYQASADEQSKFIFDNIGKRVFVQAGGSIKFNWVTMVDDAHSVTNERTYIASGAASGRPFKMFWTEHPWNAPPIDLSGKFVKMFGPSNLITPERGTREKQNGGYTIVESNVVVRGVYYDPSQQTLAAYGKVSGQFILAYYDSGSYNTLKHIQVIEVGEPDVNDMKGYIGEAILPHGTGYGTKGLKPYPVQTSTGTTQEDEFGPYYYQHKGNYSYSPKNGNIYPLRDTSEAPWRIDVYWMEEDTYGVSWPFERCEYACCWNTNSMPVLIAGDSVKIPEAYSNVELVKYQQPNGHAMAPKDRVFTSTADVFTSPTEVGYSCLKLSTTDNVWFLPIRTVARTNTDFFTLEPSLWLVGEELRPRGGTVSGTAGGYSPNFDEDVPGILNLAESGTHYNPELYYDWTTTSNDYDSVIYAVNTSSDDKPLEVHWFTSVKTGDMPEKISIPCLVQRYDIMYPEPDEVPQIVLASQKGGAGESIYEDGNALMFDAADSMMELPPMRCFSTNTIAVVSFWANASGMAVNSANRNLLHLSSSSESIGIDVNVTSSPTGGTVKYVYSVGGIEFGTGEIPAYGWHRITFAIDNENGYAFVDGEKACETNSSGFASCLAAVSTYLNVNRIGHESVAPEGLVVDSIAVGAYDVSEVGEHERLYEVPNPKDLAISMCLNFPDEDLEIEPGSIYRTATEQVSGTKCRARSVLKVMPGAPIRGTGVFLADKQPVIYRQADASKPGYNPNEEHAFIGSGSGGYFAWALRCDLNTEKTSEPGVLVQYEKDGRMAMRYFAVVLTNAEHSVLGATMTAGTILPGPHPLDTLANPWLPETYWDVVGDLSPAFPDRKNQVWARCAGTIPIHMYYPNQDGFDYVDGTTHAIGDPIAWLGNLNNGKPATWTWDVVWPENVENMRIGETLTKAANGLPEVWGAKSVAVVYPDDNGKTALLWDPTAIRKTGLSGYKNPAEMLKDFGFDPADKNVTLRGGKYTFKDLPPSVGNRFFVNASLATENCVCLMGELVTNAGGSILYPNVLNHGEIEAIEALVPNGHAKKATWDALIATLPTAPIEPSTLSTVAGKAKVDYIAKDHYAITAMGMTNYVAIIENDSTVEVMRVEDGDPISMHIFRVTDDYYPGRIVTREDPLNLLSQQLSILYTESFAGKADDYEFEWKKAVPDASGAKPTDYENVYKDVFDQGKWGGLTRFTIGQQGDTLANLVNTFYAMRYRAKEGTPAYAVMGDRWSDWCGPALAEGWIQRCVNNVTPFTQRMTDLYENRTETAITMIRAAGAPWQGDIALNQDNLTEVGLIQLYQTLLNKAESMSLTVGLNDTEANKQLLLAAERLADMYVLLGNDAYADAINPTIGFGTDYGASAVTPIIDYGFASTGLFCFDNQVSTLLDEELALLRGRTGANNPSVTTAPFYNRLVWNFTRGITAGEVAYAVNYDINSDDVDASIDEDDAALQYPQGHGDAWGHYLSAMSVWYRLLRNPNFSWSTSQMQMNVADNVVDVDYYDEERFAETAGKLARTASEIMDRTAKKAWRENSGAKGAGYLDEDENRNFGYGEWATRGGIGGVMNWMVANSLLPSAESAKEYYLATFAESTRFYMTNAPINVATGPWTFECGVKPADGAKGAVISFAGASEDVRYMPDDEEARKDWEGVVGVIDIDIGPTDGTIIASSAIRDYYLVTNETEMTVSLYSDQNTITGEVTRTYTTYDFDVRLRESSAITNTVAGVPSDAVFSIAWTGEKHTLTIVDKDGTVLADALDLGAMPMDSAYIELGGYGFTGTIDEMRMWKGARTTEQLHASRAFVNPRDENLLAYTRGFAESTAVAELPDETPSSDMPWEIENPVWMTVAESGMEVSFDDDGLLRINRATASDLETIPTEVDMLQRKLDRLDSGMNPLGLSDSAVPFDIASDGVSDGSSTHFEQIAERAKTALGNAVTILNKAQEAGHQLRQVMDAEATEDDFEQESEIDYNSQLIAIYGMPYEDDIGPTGTYPQGYDGPDIYHFMYMDLSIFGITGADNIKPVTVATYDASKGKWTYDSIKDFASNSANASTNTYSYNLSANGLVIKPDSFTGSRKMTGQIQEDYTDYILAYIDWSNACDVYNGNYNRLGTKINKIDSLLGAQETLWEKAKHNYNTIMTTGSMRLVARNLSGAMKMAGEILDDTDSGVSDASKMSGFMVGLANGLFPGLGVFLATHSVLTVSKGAFKGAAEVADAVIDDLDLVAQMAEAVKDKAEAEATWTEAQNAAFNDALDVIGELKDSAREVATTWAAMIAAAQKFDTTIAEGSRILTEREKTRARRANRLIKLRYNDMFFRQMQNEALSRYSQAFDLAQKYVYMAAQTYDYETTLLSSDRNSGDKFRASIVGTRSLGMFDDDGEPVPGQGYGDPGLADILARMCANYDVLKPRLGINNPDSQVTWFSLRSELFRIDDGEEGDADWRKELSKCIVDDIRSVPEYQRYCQPIASTSSLAAKEPALVIRFSSTIDFAKNFFGNDLEAGDHALDSSYYATKIAAAAIKFDGFPTNSLAATPVAYLVPAGADRMRVPGGGENGTVIDWNVADQVIPVPYAIGSTELDDPDYIPLYNSNNGGIDTMAKIRRIPSLRVMTEDAPEYDYEDEGIGYTRLIGRSAWNTKWVMIIPAGQLLGGSAENRQKALSILINGEDADRDGVTENPGISDIELGLKTYATSGN